MSFPAAWSDRLIVGALRGRMMVLFPRILLIGHVIEIGRPGLLPFYFTRNGFEFSPEAVVTVRRTMPFFAPLGTVVVMRSLVSLNLAG